MDDAQEILAWISIVAGAGTFVWGLRLFVGWRGPSSQRAVEWLESTRRGVPEMSPADRHANLGRLRKVRLRDVVSGDALSAAIHLARALRSTEGKSWDQAGNGPEVTSEDGTPQSQTRQHLHDGHDIDIPATASQPYMEQVHDALHEREAE